MSRKSKNSDDLNMNNTQTISKTFVVLVILSQILGLASIVLTAIWVGSFWGGFSWTQPKLIFNYHPLFMVLGMVFLYGDSILVYRVFRNYPKLPIKVLHAVLHILAFLFAILGLKAVFDFHNINNIPNLYSLHSWLGITAVVLFGLQWVGGLLAFLFPYTPQDIRRTSLPIHVAMGSLLYLLIIAVCVSGFTEKNIFSQGYSKLLPRELIGNFAGVCVILFGCVIYYLVNHPDYRRREILPVVND